MRRYIAGVADNNGDRLDARSQYTITFRPAAFAVNAFWSVTMYDGKPILIENPIKRYLIKLPMLPDLKKKRTAR